MVYDLPTDQSFGYTYNDMGNIATYTDANGTVTYTYDDLGQLKKAVGSTTYSYTYDSAGNILTANGHSYTYGDADWRDLLTKYDNVDIIYDSIGNPTSYYNGTQWTFSWEHGRMLSTASGGGSSISYTYDVDGIRTSKTVNGTKHTYYYAGGKLLRETFGSNTLDFFYDVSGNPYALKHNGTTYYYITNLQGDVMSIVNGSGTVVASYQYDPFGNLVSTEPAANSIGAINPLRYRGYVYDTESRLYYLQSRYYDPKVGRFINADALVSTGQGILGYNMFTYCRNNPVNLVDSSGNYPEFLDIDPNAQRGLEFAEWLINQDENERNEDDELTFEAKVKRFFKLLWNNLEFSCGIGMGCELSADVLDIGAVGVGMHADMICVHLEDGEFSFGQELQGGISATAFFQNVGFVESIFNKDFEAGTSEISKGFWGDESLTIASVSFYRVIGCHVRLGFDVVTFCQEWDSLFS